MSDYPSGQRGLAVNQLAFAFGSSNLSSLIQQDVAQLGSASALGAESRQFESAHLDVFGDCVFL
jgi:hypothetical protein